MSYTSFIPFLMDDQQSNFFKLQKPMRAQYSHTMDTAQKKKLSREGRSDKAAAAIRIKAARKYAGLSQEKLGEITSRGNTNVSNVERALIFPSWKMMTYFYEEHRVDLNFIVLGVFSQLPADVQEGLFAELAKLEEIPAR